MNNLINIKLEHVRSISNDELASFSMLYGPIISPLAFKLYLLCESILQANTIIKNELYLCETLACSLLECQQARVELEQFMLVKTYLSSDEKLMVIALQPVLTGKAFLLHEVLSRYYMKQKGRKMHLFNQKAFEDKKLAQTEYREITQPFDYQLLGLWNEQEESSFQKYVSEQPKINNTFDLQGFLDRCSELTFPTSARTKESLELIARLGTIYKISPKDMIFYVGRCMDFQKWKLKPTHLKDMILKQFEPEENENIYEMSPAAFLKMKQHGVDISKADHNLLFDLSNKFHLTNEVINVLVEYVLSIQDERLERNYVEKIAAVWVRKNINSYEQAKQMTVKPTKKQEAKNVPEWFKKEDELSESSPELDNQLAELIKGRR